MIEFLSTTICDTWNYVWPDSIPTYIFGALTIIFVGALLGTIPVTLNRNDKTKTKGEKKKEQGEILDGVLCVVAIAAVLWPILLSASVVLVPLALTVSLIYKAAEKTTISVCDRLEKKAKAKQVAALALLEGEELEEAERNIDLDIVEFKRLYINKKTKLSFIPFALKHRSADRVDICGLQGDRNLEVPYFEFIKKYKVASHEAEKSFKSNKLHLV